MKTLLIISLLAAVAGAQPCDIDNQFEQPIVFPTSIGAMEIVVGDLDGDGDPDIVEAGSHVTVAINNDLQFSISYPLFGTIRDVTLGDADGDGALDIAASRDGSIVLMLNLGGGTFVVDEIIDDVSHSAVQFGDLDGDGDDDLLAGMQPGFGVYYNEEGTFVFGGTYPVPNGVGWAQLADLDGDGDIDAVTLDTGFNGTFSVHLNYGDGSFAPQVTYGAGVKPSGLSIGDANEDQFIDVLITTIYGATIYANDGTGSFEYLAGLLLGSGGGDIGDINGDGKSDIAAACRGDDEFAVTYPIGDNDKYTYREHEVLEHPTDVAFADFNLDGALDVVACTRDSTTSTLFINRCVPCSADFNGDGELDILDFVAFQLAFTGGQVEADCDTNGSLDVLDFVCFQLLFQAGCP